MKAFESHQNEELSETPLLHSLKKSSFFEEPAGYFDQLPGILSDRLNEQDPVEAAPVLGSLERKHIFRVPQGYFEALPGQIRKRIREQQAPRTIVRNLWASALQPQHALSVAAVVLLFVLGVWVMPREAAYVPQAKTQQFTSEELLAMVDVDEIDTEMLVEILGEESINGLDLLKDWDMPEEDMDDLLDQIDFDDLNAGDVW